MGRVVMRRIAVGRALGRRAEVADQARGAGLRGEPPAVHPGLVNGDRYPTISPGSQIPSPLPDERKAGSSVQSWTPSMIPHRIIHPATEPTRSE